MTFTPLEGGAVVGEVVVVDVVIAEVEVVDVEIVEGVVVDCGDVVLGGEVGLVLPAASHAVAEVASPKDVPIGAATTTEPSWSEIA